MNSPVASALKRRPGEIQVRLGRDRQKVGLRFGKLLQVFVHASQAGGVLELGLLLRDRIVLALEQLLGSVTPCAEVVLVEHDEIPVHDVEPLVLGLDVAVVVPSEKILERAEVDDRLLRIDLRRIAAGRP